MHTKAAGSIHPLHVLAILLALAAVLAAWSAPARAESAGRDQGPLVFGVLPILSTERLVAHFQPLVDYLAEHSGLAMRMEAAPDYATFVQRTNHEHRYDLIFTAPHFYYIAQREAGYRVLVRVDSPAMQALIAVPTDSSVATVRDLAGKRLATTDRLALGTVLVRELLRTEGLDPDHDVALIETPSHNASLVAAYKGVTDAAGLMVPPYLRAAPEIRDAMRVVAKTAGTPHMPIAAAPWLDAARGEKIRAVLVAMSQDEQGRAILAKMLWQGLVAAEPAEYDAVEPYAKQLPPGL